MKLELQFYNENTEMFCGPVFTIELEQLHAFMDLAYRSADEKFILYARRIADE